MKHPTRRVTGLFTFVALLLLAGCGRSSSEAELKPKLLEIAALVQAGKNDEATRAVNALLVVYPDEPRLLALRAQATGEAAGGAGKVDGRVPAPVVGNQPPVSVDAGLAEVNRLVQADQLPEALASARRLAAAYPQDGRVAALVKQVAAAQPPERPAVLTPDDLAGLERVKYESGAQLLREAQAAGTAQPQVRAEKVKAFLAQTAELAAARPGLLKLHLQRATAALEVQDREAGVQAVAALLPLGVLETKDAAQLALLGKLDLAGWLSEGRALGEAGPALAELKRLAEAKDFSPAFTTRAAEFYTKWKGAPAILARAVPLVAAAETATRSDFGGWGINTNANARAVAEAKAAAERRERDSRAVLERGSRVVIADLDLTLLPIAAGSFRMGSTNGGDDEKPVTEVRITQRFWLGKTEVTQRQWREVMGSNPSSFKGDALPVETEIASIWWTEARPS